MGSIRGQGTKIKTLHALQCGEKNMSCWLNKNVCGVTYMGEESEKEYIHVLYTCI